MTFYHNSYQGKIGEAKDKKGNNREIHVYRNSSDFPDKEMIILVGNDINDTERVPINEEIWQRIGVCLGYKFVKCNVNKEEVSQ